MRLVYVIVAALGLVACEQEPDYVLDTQLALETGGIGGTGGTGGTSGTGGTGGTSGLPDDCDPRLARAALLFARIDDTCTYPYSNTELHELLRDLIYTQDVPELTPLEAEMHPDALCALFRVPWRPDIEPGDEAMAPDITTVLICPRYCIALENWVIEHGGMALHCIPDAGS